MVAVDRYVMMPAHSELKKQRSLNLKLNVEVTGVARLYRAAPVRLMGRTSLRLALFHVFFGLGNHLTQNVRYLFRLRCQFLSAGCHYGLVLDRV